MRVLVLLPLLALLAGCAARIVKSRPVTETLHRQPQTLPGERRAADAVAQRELMEMHFSAEGRGMHLAPGYLRQYHATSWTGLTNLLVRDRWGFNIADGRAAGLFDVHYKNMTVGAAGCASCHSGKAAGRFYPGLGNKNFDVTQLGIDLARLESAYAAVTPFTGEKREVEQSAIRFAKTVGDPDLGNQTQGMVPVSIVFAWFYQQRDAGTPATRGAVKVPALWGYSAKRPAGKFCDGLGAGDAAVWAMGVELAAGQDPESIRALLPAINRADDTLSALLPAPYPFAIDHERARRGAAVFARNCRECHGSYERDASGLPALRPPRWVAWDDVRTDEDRLDLVTPEFRQLVAASPLSDLIKISPAYRRGYFAPRLEGVWARFPYLHNGSVPSVLALLTPPEERPRVFSLKRAGERERFDEARLGLTLPDAQAESALLRRGAKGDHSVYDTRRHGHSPKGHAFGTGLAADEKAALIEYLKTL